MPIKTTFLVLSNDLWSRMALSRITLALDKPIGSQRLGRPNDQPSTMVGVMVDQLFAFPNKVIELLDNIG